MLEKLSKAIEEVFFKRIGKLTDIYTSKVNVNYGVIDSDLTRACNCNIRPSEEKKMIRVAYLNSRELRSIDPVFEKKLYYGFSTVLRDAFVKENEGWNLEFENHTNHYELELHFPLQRMPKSCALIEIDRATKVEEELTDKKPLVIGPTVSIHLFHLDTKKNYRVKGMW